ncbi:MAG TPA: MarR family winged helix-turn-helix transcriptional regulator [Acidimicrobiales bacterium]|nr:MarR family winged helix-turn-helix transcriptional regulator [Acidimicrobiales bacterium]
MHEVATTYAGYFPAVYMRFHRRDGKRAGLTNASRAVLQHLALAGPLTVGELGEHLGRAQSVVSEIVSQLAAKGLLERQTDRHDHRRRLIWLSDQGKEEMQRDRQVLSVELLERALAAMASDERAALVRATSALLRADGDAHR